MSKTTTDKDKRIPDKSPPAKGEVGKPKPGKDELSDKVIEKASGGVGWSFGRKIGT